MYSLTKSILEVGKNVSPFNLNKIKIIVIFLQNLQYRTILILILIVVFFCPTITQIEVNQNNVLFLLLV